ncbi:MAG: DsbE family thiol:disulfide interchange protein [Methylococcaceae bacterium]|nr:DsbE family thiol:disulfide interchange protein [Methylococcaceae bacterium]
MVKFLIPLALFVVMAVFLTMGLSLNPRDIPSPLIDKPAPEFSLPALNEPVKILSKEDFAGKVWLLNVWASWCVSCRQEHPVFVQFARKNSVTIVGLNYKDDPRAAKQWLAQLGNPYKVSIMDQEGRTGIDYGVYGVPETFVIDKKGVVRYKHTGPVTMQDVQEILIPLIDKLKLEV